MKNTIFFLLLVAVAGAAKPQGCSDAGFCTIGSLSHRGTLQKAKAKHQLVLTLPIGLGDENVFVFTPGLEYRYILNQWQFAGKLTGNYASGELGNASAPGDVFLSATYQTKGEKIRSSFTLGTKLPLSAGNLKTGGVSLPMQYQSSLGTVDLIAGAALLVNRWQFAAGWQQPLTGSNRNNFLPQYWSDAKAVKYPPTNDFNRKGDVLLRSAYRLLQKNKFKLEGGLLGIYHLGEDTYVDANQSTRPISIKGSGGLTLNLTALAELQLNNKWTIGLTGGAPLVVRDVRPDGLTRSFVLAPQLKYQF